MTDTTHIREGLLADLARSFATQKTTAPKNMMS